ncbi:MAG: LysM domain-containing protein [Verrucomicrobiota bacterium]
MDNLSSADLDSSSKTPLYVGIAAVILAALGVALGWLGFSKNKELVAQIEELKAAQADSSAIEAQIDEKVGGVDAEMRKGMENLASQLSSQLKKVSDDVRTTKTSIRKVAIDAGTALKKVEALEKEGIRVATTTRPRTTTAPASGKPSASSSGSPKPSTSGSDAGTYTVAGGDTLAGIAGKFKINLNALLEANPGVDPYRLQIGQKLVIPGAK